MTAPGWYFTNHQYKFRIFFLEDQKIEDSAYACGPFENFSICRHSAIAYLDYRIHSMQNQLSIVKLMPESYYKQWKENKLNKVKDKVDSKEWLDGN